jgi:hypothetical protein
MTNPGLPIRNRSCNSSPLLPETIDKPTWLGVIFRAKFLSARVFRASSARLPKRPKSDPNDNFRLRVPKPAQNFYQFWYPHVDVAERE